MARKPFKGSTIDNVLKNGLGAMNIDATRVPWADASDSENHNEWTRKYNEAGRGEEKYENYFAAEGQDRPSEAVSVLKKKKSDDGRRVRNAPPEEMVPHPGITTEKKKKSDKPKPQPLPPKGHTGFENFKTHSEYKPAIDCELSTVSDAGRYPSNVIGEVAEGYQKYFYCPKVSRKERHSGFEMPEALTGHIKGCYAEDGSRMAVGMDAAEGYRGNNHPTVKPVALMDYLIKLVTPPSTPNLQRKVLDPFMGSGSTGMAAVALGHHFTGCELDPRYVEISKTRIEAWNIDDLENLFEDLAENSLKL